MAEVSVEERMAAWLDRVRASTVSGNGEPEEAGDYIWVSESEYEKLREWRGE